MADTQTFTNTFLAKAVDRVLFEIPYRSNLTYEGVLLLASPFLKTS